MESRKDRFEYDALRAVIRIIQSLAPRTAVKIGRRLGDFIYYIIPIRKSIVLENLTKAFPEKSARERKRIARMTYENFGQTFFEFLRNPVRSKEETLSRVVLHNEAILQNAHENGSGTLLMTGHFGNWEMMACVVVALGFPLVVIARPQRNRLVDALINQYRRAAGIETVSLGMGVRAFLRALGQNKFVAILADQDAHREGVFVDFMGRPSSTAPGPAIFALKTGAEIVFVTSVLRRDGKYDAFFEKIETNDVSGLTSENIKIITQRHVRKLEEKVRRWPHHWFWMHRRWKTSPEQANQKQLR